LLENQRLSAAVVTENRAEKCLYVEFATEPGDVLFRAAQEIRQRLDATRHRLTETSERPAGSLKVTATIGIGGIWLARRIAEFLDLYPEVRIGL
jgi:DNA-binding transcriptional LysR family regulator